MPKTDTPDPYSEVYLPSWAVAPANGQYTLGTHLATKDGRRIGNAHIVEIRESKYILGLTIYMALTDAGNLVPFTAQELETVFHEPLYVSNLEEVKTKFWRPGVTACSD